MGTRGIAKAAGNQMALTRRAVRRRAVAHNCWCLTLRRSLTYLCRCRPTTGVTIWLASGYANHLLCTYCPERSTVPKRTHLRQEACHCERKTALPWRGTMVAPLL